METWLREGGKKEERQKTRSTGEENRGGKVWSVKTDEMLDRVKPENKIQQIADMFGGTETKNREKKEIEKNEEIKQRERNYKREGR